MPVTPTYPGVYIEEIPSGVRTITGVATSVAAFIGRAQRGPVNEPITINSYADYERKFGGLSLHSMMSFAVRDFFRNGGGQAVIGRLYESINGGPELAEIIVGEDPNTLILAAAYEGDWGNQLRVRVDHNVLEEVALSQGEGVNVNDLFNIYIFDAVTGALEEFRNVTVIDGPRRLDKVLENESDLVRVVDDSMGETRPTASIDPEGGDPWELEDNHYSISVAADANGLLTEGSYNGSGKAQDKEGLYLLKKTDIFNLLCLPPEWDDDHYPGTLLADALSLCEEERALMLMDPDRTWTSNEDVKNDVSVGITTSKNAALYYPLLLQPNPLRDNQIEPFVPCGAVAGVMARTDTTRGVWKAPAGQEATLRGVPDLSVKINDGENGELNPLAVNCLRSFPIIGRTVWGSRTMNGADVLASEWKYVPIRRLALYIEESLFRGTQWVVFEPNDEPLWAQIRLNIGAFMNNLFRQGAFQGSSPREAYLVKCDSETNTQNDIDRGIVNIVVGFAPLKPAEFVILKIQQLAGQIET